MSRRPRTNSTTPRRARSTPSTLMSLEDPSPATARIDLRSVTGRVSADRVRRVADQAAQPLDVSLPETRLGHGDADPADRYSRIAENRGTNGRDHRPILAPVDRIAALPDVVELGTEDLRIGDRIVGVAILRAGKVLVELRAREMR